MAKKNTNPGQNWAAIGYPTEQSRELDSSFIAEAFVNAAKVSHSFGRTWAVALSPLHSPDISQEQREVLIQQVRDKYQAKIDKARSDGARKSLELKRDEEIEEVENKELKQHYHLQIRFRKLVRASAAGSHLQQLSSLIQIGGVELLSFTRVERVGNCGKYFEYLTHSNDFDKEQFDELPIVYPSSFRFSSKQDTEESKDMKLSEIEELAFSGNFKSYVDLYKYVSTASKRDGALEWAMVRSIMRRNMQHLDKIAIESFNSKRFSSSPRSAQ